MQFLRMFVLMGTLFAVGGTQVAQAKPTPTQMAIFLGRFVAASGIAGLATIIADMYSKDAGFFYKGSILLGTSFLATRACLARDINLPGKTVSLFGAGDITLPAELNWYNAIDAAGALALWGVYTYRDVLYTAWEKLAEMAAEAARSN